MTIAAIPKLRLLTLLVALLICRRCQAHTPSRKLSSFSPRNNKSTRNRALRGQKRKEKTERKARKPPAEKKGTTKGHKEDPAKRQYQTYNHFVEACQEELVADVINGGIIKHTQYANFIYGYCSENPFRGNSCKKADQGFTGLPNDMKLMYIKSFCPEDVNGQVSCLHGINDRGRDYQFNEELDKLCKDLEVLLLKNGFLQEDGYNVPDLGGGEAGVGGGTQPGSDPMSDPGNHNEPTTISGVDVIGAYQSNVKPGGGNQEYTFVGQTDTTTTAPAKPPVKPPTPRPTRTPTPGPTPSPKHGGGKEPAAESKTQLPPWERPTGSAGANAVGILEEDADAQIPGRGTVAPEPTTTPTYKPLGLAVLDEHGNPIATKTDNDKAEKNEGMSAGSIVAIVLIVLLGIAIAFSTLLLYRKRQRLLEAQGNYAMHRGVFFMNLRKVKPGDGETATHDKTLEEQNESIGSETEIHFHGPLFESWPSVTPSHHMQQDDDDEEHLSSAHPSYSGITTLGGDRTDTTTIKEESECDVDEFELTPGDETSTDPEPASFASSLLSSFFSRAKRGGPGPEASTDNAIDEIKRAINDAQWQEVYYLASKMAAEGNIDSNENLQSALVKSNEQGEGNFAKGPTPSRNHLKSDDAARAAQLDLSLAVGDWITLAARAAVFAALDSANNPVPTAIFVNEKDKSNVEECLAKAKKALEEAQKAEAKKRARQQASSINSEATATDEVVMFVDADDDGASDYEYPKEDYSDFSRTSNSDEYSTSEYSSQRLPGPPSQPVKRQEAQAKLAAFIEDVESSDEESVSSATRVSIPGPPSIAMSNQSTIPTVPSTSATPVPFAFIEDASRGPFQRDFENGIAYPLDQEEETERTPNISV